MKIGQLIEHRQINIFLQKSCGIWARKASSRTLLFFKKALNEVKASGLQHSFVAGIWIQMKHMHQVSTDALFCLVVLGSQSADEEVFQFLPDIESGICTLLGSNLKPKISLFSISKTQRRRLSEI